MSLAGVGWERGLVGEGFVVVSWYGLYQRPQAPGLMYYPCQEDNGRSCPKLTKCMNDVTNTTPNPGATVCECASHYCTGWPGAINNIHNAPYGCK